MYGYFSTPRLFLYCQSGTEPVNVQRCLRMRSIRPSVCIRMTRDSAGLGERVPSCSARASPPTHSPRSRRLTSRDRTNGGRQIRALTRNLQQPLRCQPISWGGRATSHRYTNGKEGRVEGKQSATSSRTFLFLNMDEQPGGGGGGGMASQRQQQPAPQQGNNSINPQIASAGGAPMVQQQQDEMPRPQQYTIPGILHYIQHEWARFEMERAHWEVERAELQVQTRGFADTLVSNSKWGH